MNAIVPAGNFATDFFVHYMADNLGRRNTLTIGLLVLFLGIGLQTGATIMGMFLAGRFIGGVGSSMGTGLYLISEGKSTSLLDMYSAGNLRQDFWNAILSYYPQQS